MRDDVLGTPAGTDTALGRAAGELVAVLRDSEVWPPASMNELILHLQRLLVNAQVATTAGNHPEPATLALALTDVRAHARAIEKAATATLEALLDGDQELAAWYGEMIRRQRE